MKIILTHLKAKKDNFKTREKEIEFYLNESNSVAAVTLNQFYEKFAHIRANVHIKHLIIADIADELSLPVRIGFYLTQGRKIPKVPTDAPVILWNELLEMGKKCDEPYEVHKKSEDLAVILYSGGTTGTTKGIMLSNRNFNALSRQVIGVNPMFKPGDKMLAAMPVFHGFGLGVCIHTTLCIGMKLILIPDFSPKKFVKIIETKGI